MSDKLHLFSKKKKSLFSLTLIFALLTMVLLPIPMSFAAPIIDVPIGVNGRILAPDMTGDTSNWVEIAKNGDYSLIVRENFINIYNQASYYSNPEWQYVSYGSTNSYTTSNVRNKINDWFNGVAKGATDNLPANARLRDYTMQNNAISVLGTSCDPAKSLTNGFSKPTIYQVGIGNDVAFALSYGEAANFCSKLYFMREMSIANQPSSTLAVSNYNKVSIPAGYVYTMWLRSSGDLSSTASAMSNNDGSFGGRVFQNQLSSTTEKGLVYPAVWVNSAIFETRYDVTVHDSYAAVTGAGSYAVGTTVTVDAGSRYGYVFNGWDVQGIASLPNNSVATFVMPANNVVVTANWAVGQYNIDYDVNGGVNAPDNPTSYAVSALPISIANPSRSGYTFSHWSATCANGTVVSLQNGVIPVGTTGDVMLSAVWTIIQYNITYTLSGGTNAPGNPTTYTVENAHLLSVANPELRGYTFLRWMVRCANGTIFELTSAGVPVGTTGDLAIMAIWDPVPILYSITYVLDGGANAPGNPDEYAVTSLFPVDIANPSRAGYLFLGWVVIYSNGTIISLVPSYSIPAGSACDVTLQAVWNQIVQSYSISYVLNGGVNAPGSPVLYDVTSLPLSIADPSMSGFVFSYWVMAYANGSLVVLQSGVIPVGTTGDVVLTAVWTVAPTYSIAYSLSGGTNALGNPVSYTVDNTFPISIADPSMSGHTFLYWIVLYDNGTLGVLPASGIAAGTTGDITLIAVWYP
jgi:uncharacterized repeat protein (TIGR02543 family)